MKELGVLYIIINHSVFNTETVQDKINDCSDTRRISNREYCKYKYKYTCIYVKFTITPQRSAIT